MVQINSLRTFDPRRVAALETRMWRAYYKHNFVSLLGLAVAFFKEQLDGSSGWVALRLAYYATVAALRFQTSKPTGTASVLKWLTKYYRLLAAQAAEHFNYKKAAQTELEWWLIHRYPSRGALQYALAKNMSVIYSVDPKELMAYGEARAKAMELRDNAARANTNPDWKTIAQQLEHSYASLSAVVNKQPQI